MAYKKLKYWFDRELARMLASRIVVLKSTFDSASFVTDVDRGVQDLELKARVALISDMLHKYLADSYVENLKILMKILGPENPEETGMFTEYYWVMPIAYYVEKYGLDHPDISLAAIEEITKRNTGEYAIRPYLTHHPKVTLNKMQIWAGSPNFHVRRLASEGGRPRLPWAAKMDRFIEDPSPLLPILRMLRDDPVKYVQKSVANCLNDIIKDNPDLAKEEVESWIRDATASRKWIIKHALRTLKKKDDPWAMGVIGGL